MLDPDAGEQPATVCTATALFTDLRGFTGLGERYADDPAGLLAEVNEHFSVVARALLRCGGVIEKYVGDGVFATFGAHGAMPDHRERALAAAIAVVGANESLNRRRARAGRPRLEVGVGVADGRMVVGSVGAPERRELGVLGDPVNVAARLVAKAAPGEVLLTENVYHALSASVRAEVVGGTVLRGRVGEVTLYRVSLLNSPREGGSRAT